MGNTAIRALTLMFFMAAVFGGVSIMEHYENQKDQLYVECVNNANIPEAVEACKLMKGKDNE